MSKSVPLKLENFICYCLAGVQIMGDARVYLVRFTRDSKNLTGRPFRGVEFDLCQGGVGKIEVEVTGFKRFFSFGHRSR